MGVQGLWPLLGTHIHFNYISLWLHQASKGYNTYGIDSKCPHISLLLNRISKLLFYKIRPVFIFDGPNVPLFKRQVLRERDLKKYLDDIIINKQQIKALETVAYNSIHNTNESEKTLSEIPTKKQRKSDENIFQLPSTSNINNMEQKKNLEHALKQDLDINMPDYLDGYEKLGDGDSQEHFLKEAKEKCRKARLRLEEIPNDSQKFSNFQLERLLNRNKINTQMDLLKKNMMNKFAKVSDDNMKMVILDPQKRSHVLMHDDEILFVNTDKQQREKVLRESLSWPEFLKEIDKQTKKEKLSNTIRTKSDEQIIDDEDDALQEAMLASLLEQKAFGLENFKALPESGFIRQPKYTSTNAKQYISSGNTSDDDYMETNSHSITDNEDYFLRKKELKIKPIYDGENGIVTECQQLLTYLGLPFMVAIGEAEAQCVELERLGIVDGVVSDDSDVWLFGASVVYKNMFSKSKHVQEYKIERIIKETGLTRREFILLSMLSGGDYTRGFEKIGVVSAIELIAEFLPCNIKQLGKDDEIETISEISHGAFKRWNEFITQTIQQYQTRITTFTVPALQTDKSLPTSRVLAALDRIKNVNLLSNCSMEKIQKDTKKTNTDFGVVRKKNKQKTTLNLK